ncbi:hypothetical protein G3N55_05720 [Dissulfurirhabdus thermomarina]|uniref:PASTA domain-containing protein n=1 Tax=Dissulfurirhabdus thermomarina TaxID=1765737 RepID=A0A6N9TMI5_DISTH|nr:penicillin-binding transpeptidase domain-containing protein [Dissulfurirhabdus thermomarina]NDY42339.1 hypothetical protein [Dissulfurirhabdus thermomarina]
MPGRGGAGGRLQGLRGLGGGVDLVEAWRRVYPYGEAACAVLGYVSPEGRGLDGVEYLLDTARAGGDRPIALNLDIGLQIQTERVLRRVSAGLGAGRGCFVVMDVRSGAVSAMANWPAWDPARFYATDRERLGNRSLRADVEPAGLLAALAWASGGAAPADLAAWAWRPLGPDVRVWGPWSGSALRRLGIGAKALETLWRFRLGQATGVDLPGEETGALPALAAEADLPLDKTGVRVSPLQMLAAFSALLDGGVLHRPRIAAETPDAPARVPGEVVRPLAGLFADRGGMVLGARVREGIRGTSRRDTWRLSLLGCWPPGAPRVAYVMVLDGIAPASEALLPPWPELGRIARYAAELPADETLSATGGANGPPAAAPRRMPDLRGKSFRVALRMLQSTRLQIRIEGRGRIADQAPRPGAPLEGVRVCRLVGGEGGR